MSELPRVMILAGGLGTRLSGVLKDIPKPMAPVAGRPFLEYQIEFFKRQGFSRFTLLTGYLAYLIQNHFGDGKRFGVEIDYSPETKPLGTGGAIRQAMKAGDVDRALIVNGDSFFATDYPRLVSLSKGPATLALKFSTDLSRYGSVSINEQFVIEGFAEKSTTARDGYINAGAYVIEWELLKYFPEGVSSIEKNVFEPLGAKAILTGVPCCGPFVDIGTPQSLKSATTDLPKWLDWKPQPCLFLDRDGVIVEHVNYLHRTEDVRIVAETIELILAAKADGWRVAVISNQSGVGRGVFSQKDCTAVNLYIQKLLEKKGAGADSWHCCFEHPSEGKGEFRRTTLRRKPGPGMVLEACENTAIDLSRSLMVGDNSSDQLTLPDLTTLLVQGAYELEPHNATHVAKDFSEMLSKGQKIISSLRLRGATSVGKG